MNIYHGENEENLIKKYLNKEISYERIYPIINNLIKHIIYSKKYIALDKNTKNCYITDIHTYIWENIHKFDPYKGSKSYSWLTRVILNQISQLIIQDERDKIRKFINIEEMEINRFNDCIYIHDTSVEEEELAQEIRMKSYSVSQVVGSLEEYERIIYTLYFTDNMTMKQISQKLNIKETSIFKFIRSIRIKLRGELGIKGELPKISKK